MTDRPIIFSGPMVQALIDGRKTQTRRVLADKHGAVRVLEWDGLPSFVRQRDLEAVMNDGATPILRYSPGDRLWVKENCAIGNGKHSDVIYRADMIQADWNDVKQDASSAPWKLRSSMFMPRWASRLTLTVTDVRVQRLQEICVIDVFAEGAVPADLPHGAHMGQERAFFIDLWNGIHGPDAWDANPWVCALTFTVERRNIDQ